MKKGLFKILVMCLFVVAIISATDKKTYASELPVDMGQSYNILADISDYSQNARYSIDDSSIISVNSEGIITGLQPGTTFITIHYMSTSNVERVYTREISVNLIPGVYRIKNKQTGKYLSLSDISTKKDLSVKFFDEVDSGFAGDDYLIQLWSIDSDNSLTEFTIRPYSDKNAILEYFPYEGKIRIARMPKFMEYELTNNSIWRIVSSTIETSQQKPSGRNSLNELNVYGQGTTNDKWEFEPVSVIPNGLKLVDEYYEDATSVKTRYISLGSKKSLNDLKIRTLAYYSGTSGIGVTWSSSDTSIATVGYVSGEVIGVSKGTVTITATYYPGAKKYSESYTLTVMPYKDGEYNITNRLGFYQLMPIRFDSSEFSRYYLKRNTSGTNNTCWYLQSMIDGTYKISIANNYNDDLCYWVVRDSDYDYVRLLNYVDYLANKSTWTIQEHELGKSISYKGDANYSWRLLDSESDIVDLTSPDYEDYESMWSITERITTQIPTIYIHPYYDSQFLANFGNDREAVLEEVYSYLNNTKDLFEKELGINVVIEKPAEFVLPESEAQKLNKVNEKNPGKKDDDLIFKESFRNMVMQEVNGDEDYLKTNKYIIYQAYPLVSNSGNRYTPNTYNEDDISYIFCIDHNSRNEYATLHESAHALGVMDHNHNNHGVNGTCTVGERCSTCGTYEYKRNEFCAMNYDYFDKTEPFCNDCVIELKASLYFKCYPTAE